MCKRLDSFSSTKGQFGYAETKLVKWLTEFHLMVEFFVVVVVVVGGFSFFDDISSEMLRE